MLEKILHLILYVLIGFLCARIQYRKGRVNQDYVMQEMCFFVFFAWPLTVIIDTISMFNRYLFFLIGDKNCDIQKYIKKTQPSKIKTPFHTGHKDVIYSTHKPPIYQPKEEQIPPMPYN